MSRPEIITQPDQETEQSEDGLSPENGSNPHAVAPALEKTIYIPFGVPHVPTPKKDTPPFNDIIPFNAVIYIERAHAKALSDGVPLHIVMSGINRVLVVNGAPGTRTALEQPSKDKTAYEYYQSIRLVEEGRIAFAKAVGEVLNLPNLASVDSVLVRMASDPTYRDLFMKRVDSLSKHRNDLIPFDQISIGLEDAFTAALPRRKRPRGPIWNGGADQVDTIDHLYPMADVTTFTGIINEDGGRVMLPAGGDYYNFFSSVLSINEALRHLTCGVSKTIFGIDDETVQSSLSTHRSLNGWGFRAQKTNGDPVPVDPYYSSSKETDGVLRVPLTGLTREWMPAHMGSHDVAGYRLNKPALAVLRKMNPTVKRYVGGILRGSDEERDRFGRRVYGNSRRLTAEQWTALEQWADAKDETDPQAPPMPEKFNIVDYSGVVRMLASDIQKRMKDLLSGL